MKADPIAADLEVLMPDRANIVTIYGNRGALLEVIVPAEEMAAFTRRPEVAAVHWKRRTPWSTSEEDRAGIIALIEKNCSEYMTPGRVDLARELLAEGEPLDSSTIRDRAQERGVSYGHGNTLIDYLAKHALSEDDGPTHSRRYSLPEAELLAAEWEAGPGRVE